MGTYFVHKMGRWCLFSCLFFFLHKMDTYYYYTECRYLLQNGYFLQNGSCFFVFLLLLLHNGYFKQNGYFLQNDWCFFIFLFFIFLFLLLLHNGYFKQNGLFLQNGSCCVCFLVVIVTQWILHTKWVIYLQNGPEQSQTVSVKAKHNLRGRGGRQTARMQTRHPKPDNWVTHAVGR